MGIHGQAGRNMISQKTVGRLSLYRRLLANLQADGATSIYSYQLAELAGGTAAQVRRDLMVVGYAGNTKRGYDVADLAKSIGSYLDDPAGQRVCLMGVGNLGRALLAFFSGRRRLLSIVAAFDIDPEKVDRVIHGCRCHGVNRIPEVVKAEGITVGIIAVPAAHAQDTADLLVRAGLKGLLNFAPTPLHVPEDVYIEDIDMTMSLEKVAFFARL